MTMLDSRPRAPPLSPLFSPPLAGGASSRTVVIRHLRVGQTRRSRHRDPAFGPHSQDCGLYAEMIAEKFADGPNDDTDHPSGGARGAQVPLGYRRATSIALINGARVRKAWPRWLTASFSAGDISAVVRVSPRGRKIGS